MQMSAFLKTLGLSLIVLVACNENKDSQPATSTETRINISQIKLTELNGQLIDPGQYKGKTLFINFWATWCKPCLREMPSIQRLMEKLKDEEIVFLFASDESPEQVESFKTTHTYPFHYVRVENSADLNILALPATFIFDAEGELVFSDMGAREWDDTSNLDFILKIVKQK